MKALMILKDIKINKDGLGLDLRPNCVNDDVEQAIKELELLRNDLEDLFTCIELTEDETAETKLQNMQTYLNRIKRTISE